MSTTNYYCSKCDPNRPCTLIVPDCERSLLGELPSVCPWDAYTVEPHGKKDNRRMTLATWRRE